jgi:hypothetical protein
MGSGHRSARQARALPVGCPTKQPGPGRRSGALREPARPVPEPRRTRSADPYRGCGRPFRGCADRGSEPQGATPEWCPARRRAPFHGGPGRAGLFEGTGGPSGAAGLGGAPGAPSADPSWSACRHAGMSDRTCILMTGPSQKSRTCVLIESCHRLPVAPHLGQPVVSRRLQPGRRVPGAVLASARRGPRRLRGRRQLARRTRPASPRPAAPQAVPSGPVRTWIRMPFTGRTLEVRDENADRQ